MANTVTDEDLELDDEQKKKQAAQQTIGSMPKPNPSSVTVPAAMPAPEVGLAAPPTSTIAESTPYSPMAPRPQSQAFTDWQAQDLAKHPAGQPRYKGLTAVGDTIASAVGLERHSEFGTEGAKNKSARLAGNAAEENTQIGYGEKERSNEAALESEQAKTATEKTGSEVQQVPLPGGGTAGVMTKNIASPTAAIINSAERGQAAQTAAGAKTDVESMKEGSPLEKAKVGLTNAQADYQRFKSDPNSPMYKIAQEHLKIAQGDYALKLKEFGFNYEPSTLSPEEQATMPTDQAGQLVGLHSPLKPGGQTVMAAQRASNVVAELPRIRQEVTQLANEIGPGAGRWNDLWSGKGGFTNPQYTRVHADQDFLSSAVALAHAYGRMPQPIIAKFDKLYADSSQSAENFLAALDIAQEWMPVIARGGQTAGEKGMTPSASAPGGGVSAPSSGKIIKYDQQGNRIP
jgi:hypothetical protein